MLPARRRFKQRVAVLSLPDLAGKSVLVSGPEAHAFAAQAERGGAADVATARQLRECDLAAVGQWDVVLYLGELQDVEDPVGALRSVRSVTRELAVVETEAAAICGLEHEAVWRFVAGEDGRGRWAPNLPGLGGALTAAGFSDDRAVAGAPTELVDRPDGPRGYRAVVQGAVARRCARGRATGCGSTSRRCRTGFTRSTSAPGSSRPGTSPPRSSRRSSTRSACPTCTASRCSTSAGGTATSHSKAERRGAVRVGVVDHLIWSVARSLWTASEEEKDATGASTTRRTRRLRSTS